MKNEVFVNFRFVDFEEITHDEISQTIGIEPTHIITKGQKRNPKKPEFEGVFTKNVWIIDSPLDKYTSFEDQMNALLDIIEPKVDLFKLFAPKCYCQFACVLFISSDCEESTPWVHLYSRYNRVANELGAEFDVDIYRLPDNKNEK